jgi:hypothetical protein
MLLFGIGLGFDRIDLICVRKGKELRDLICVREEIKDSGM